MKSAVSFPPDYYLKYNEHPVKIKPYSDKQGEVGDLYVKRLKSLLKDFNVKVMVRGSTAYKISGKGDVEVGVYIAEPEWKEVVGAVEKEFGKAGNVEENYARFNFDHEGVKEVEIILLKGREAMVDEVLNDYLITHPKLLKEYEEIKKQYSYSKREYNFRKNEFLRRVEHDIHETKQSKN